MPNPAPETYLTCTCGAILGYCARWNDAIWFYLYAYPPTGVRPNLPARRIIARVLFGDAWCPHCGTWTELVLPRPWEKRKA